MTVYTKTMAQALREVYLVEDNMDLMRKAAGGAMQTLKMKDGKLKMDSFTASAIMQIYDKVNAKNKKTMENLLKTGRRADIMKLQKFAMKQIKSDLQYAEYDPEDKGPLATVDEHSNGKPHKHPHEEDEDEIDQQQQQNAQEATGTVNLKSPVMLDLLRLYNKAMSEKPNSKKQNEYKKEIAKVRKSMGMNEDVNFETDVEELEQIMEVLSPSAKMRAGLDKKGRERWDASAKKSAEQPWVTMRKKGLKSTMRAKVGSRDHRNLSKDGWAQDEEVEEGTVNEIVPALVGMAARTIGGAAARAIAGPVAKAVGVGAASKFMKKNSPKKDVQKTVQPQMEDEVNEIVGGIARMAAKRAASTAKSVGGAARKVGRVANYAADSGNGFSSGSGFDFDSSRFKKGRKIGKGGEGGEEEEEFKEYNKNKKLNPLSIGRVPTDQEKTVKGAVKSLKKQVKAIPSYKKQYLGIRDRAIGREQREEVELDEAKKKKKHNCASKVKHEEYGIGKCISGMHDLDESGNVAHYDVEFEDIIVENVPVKDLEILVTEMHEHIIHEAKYDLYHKDFSSAMQHAYKMAKKLHGITIDPKEIDDKVATGPSKPSSGKTNKYRLKGDKGSIQVQVYNKGGSKPFELNMYKEEVDLGEAVVPFTKVLKKNKQPSFSEKKMPFYIDIKAEQLDKLGETNSQFLFDKLKKNKGAADVGERDVSFHFKTEKDVRGFKSDLHFANSGGRYGKLELKHYTDSFYFDEEVELDEVFDFVLLDKDNKIAGRYSGSNAKKDAESGKKSAHLPPMSIPKGDVKKMKIVPIAPKDKKGIGDTVLAIGEAFDLEEGKMKELQMYIQQGKPPVWISRRLGIDIKTVKSLMAGYGESVKEGAAADARRAIGRDPQLGRKKDSADYDISATDDDVKAASKNIMMQLRKAQTLRGKFDVEFMDRKKHKVPSKIAQAVTARYMALKRPAEKQEFQNKISKSYKDMLKSLDEAINNEGFIFEHKKQTILERIDTKLMERKNG